MEFKKDKWDVVIIGAGPAGSTAARIIAEAGFDCLMVEKDKEPGLHNSCAGGMPYALAQKLKISSQIIEKEIYGCALHLNSGTTIWHRKRPQFITVYRRVFDKLLAERAVNGGAELILLTKVYDVKKEKESFNIYIINKVTKKTSRLSSKLVIFADGVNTLAQRSFGIGFEKRSNNLCLGLTYEMEAKENSLNKFEVYFDSQTIPWGWYWIFPKRDRLSVGVGCLQSKIKKNLKACLDEFIENHPLLKNKKKLRHTAGLIPLSLAKRMASDSCMVIGDAAGMVNPLTGGGLVYAIKSGELAGLACIEALKKRRYEAKVLSRYPKKFQRTKHFWWLKVLSLVNGIFIALSDMVGKSLYPALMKLYFHFFILLPQRFLKNI